MKEQDRIWMLMARKLSGEATPDEIAELARFQQEHPEMTYSLQMLSDLWRSRAKEEPDADDAYQRHLTRMALRDLSKPAAPDQAKPLVDDPRLNSRGRMALDLFLNYFKTAWRSLSRNRGFSAINISGLSIGLASAIVLLLWIRNELTFDQFHKNRDRVYQVLTRSAGNGHIDVDGGTPTVLGPVIQTAYRREVDTVVRMSWVGAFIFSVGDKHIQTQGYTTDPGFFQLFTFPLLKGDPATALNGPRSMVLTEKLAKKLFGDQDPMGRTVKVDSTSNFVVTAVIRDLPPNTRFTFEYLLPWSYMREVHWEKHNWKIGGAETFVLLHPGVSEEMADKSMRMIIHENAPDINSEVFLHPMRKWHLYSNFNEGRSSGGEINFVRMLAFIAAFILLIACINYMNLSTARSIRRAREVGIRKVVGAGRGSLIGRFLGESMLIAILAGVLALGIVAIALPWFNHLVLVDLSIPWNDPWFWLGGSAFILFTGLLAGSYPAFYLSAFRPVNILRGHFKTIHALVTPRRLLVIFQFTFAITFIICTIVMYREFSYVWRRDSGYNKENLGFVYIKGDIAKNYAAIRNELFENRTITDITRTNAPISETWTWDNNYHWNGESLHDPVTFVMFRTDRHFTSTMGLHVLAGRDIDIEKYPTDSTAMLLTETAVKRMGFSDPIGQIVYNSGDSTTWHVVGVINDFVTGSLFNHIQPIVVQGPRFGFGTINFRFNPSNAPAVNIARLAAILRKYNPNYPFEYFSGGQYDNLKVRSQEHLGSLAALFAGMAIFISCLGLFGLSAYMAETRLREIGVRKILGASIMRLAALLSKDFLVLVFIAFIIASPVAWWFMKQWLDDIPYHIDLNWSIFAFTGILSMFIAAGTVSYQAIRAALSNPVRVLRTD
ncbi:MAG TPA: ABC transporter permease [Puia sp.]|nr:ABC transporter permease [Puia sp.]